MPAAEFNIVLIGYRGTGKTSVARELAARVGWPWYDADVEIERAAGKSIAEIFATSGENTFRDWETHVIEQLSENRGAILATGGGAVLRNANCEAMKRHGRFVWLRATAETIHDRLRQDATTAARRPSLTDMSQIDEIYSLLITRTPIYEKLAQQTLDTDFVLIGDLVTAIIKHWNLPLAAEAP